MKRADVRAILEDASLPDAAARVGVWVMLQDRGEGVEVRHEDVARLLHGYPGRDKIRGALRALQLAGYLTREPGGRGHGDVFRVGVEPHPKNRVGVEPHPINDLGSGPSPPLKDRVGVEPHPKTHVVVEDDVVVEEEGARGRAVHELDLKVGNLLAGESNLTGCRKPLADYLTSVVQTPRQWGYVQTLRSWLDGGVGSPRGLMDLPAQERTHLLATALNELLADDELAYKSARGRRGNPATLRSKLEYLLNRSHNDDRTKPGGNQATGRRRPRVE